MSDDTADYVVVIASWEDEPSRSIRIQNFVRQGETFIPVFSDEDRFRAEAAGSGFEDQGISIRKDLLRDILRGDELLILNPGSDAMRLHRDDL